MDRHTAVVLRRTIFVGAKRTDTGLVSVWTRGGAADVHGQLGETGHVHRTVIIDLQCTAVTASVAGRRAVVSAIEKGRHIGPSLTVDLVEKALGRDSVVAFVLKAVCAAGDRGPVCLPDYVDGGTAVGLRGIGAGRVAQVLILSFGHDLAGDGVPIILLHRPSSDVRT